jgi:hypothetical protein
MFFRAFECGIGSVGYGSFGVKKPPLLGGLGELFLRRSRGGGLLPDRRWIPLLSVGVLN